MVVSDVFFDQVKTETIISPKIPEAYRRRRGRVVYGSIGNLDTELDSASLMKGELVTIMVADQKMGIDDGVIRR